jgi:formylglycine-generating enzyme required for sulfatase activity
MEFPGRVTAQLFLILTVLTIPWPLAAGEVEEIREEILGGLILVPGGEFFMGYPQGNPDEKPLHRVRVGDFLLGRHEVTQAQWSRVMGRNPSMFTGCRECPVENVSWSDVEVFLERAGRLTGLDLRLPTEAEWEYAAGGGDLHQRWSGTEIPEQIGQFAVLADNSDGRPQPVGTRKANSYGLYDMSGNVWEWCSDYYSGEYYTVSPVDNPTGPESGRKRVLRGGSWVDEAVYLRVANRNGYPPGGKNGYLGFRLAMDPPEKVDVH